MKRTNAAIEREVVTLIALNERYANIYFQTGVAVPTIKKIKQRNSDTIATLKQHAFETQAEQVSSIVGKANTMLLEQLAKSEQDQRQLDMLERQLLNNDISRGEYVRSKRKLKPLSVRELLAITKTAQRQIVLEQNV